MAWRSGARIGSGPGSFAFRLSPSHGSSPRTARLSAWLTPRQTGRLLRGTARLLGQPSGSRPERHKCVCAYWKPSRRGRPNEARRRLVCRPLTSLLLMALMTDDSPVHRRSRASVSARVARSPKTAVCACVRVRFDGCKGLLVRHGRSILLRPSCWSLRCSLLELQSRLLSLCPSVSARLRRSRRCIVPFPCLIARKYSVFLPDEQLQPDERRGRGCFQP